jgi:hypothetical protein
MISIITCTGRKEPQFKLLADTIVANVKRVCDCDRFEWIVVDMLLWDQANAKARTAEVEEAVRGRIRVIHVPPKPNVWQGPTRLTTQNRFALCNARNTGLAYANFGHVAFLDDCLAAGTQWLPWHAYAARKHVALAGSYISTSDITVENGIVKGWAQPQAGYEDHRTTQGDFAIPQKVGGGWLYGLNMSFPLDYALKAGGYDEQYDGQAGVEDCDFGIRLERAGCPVFFGAECAVFQVLKSHDAVCGYSGHGQHQHPKERKLKDGKMHFANEKLVEELFEEPGRYKGRRGVDLRKLREHVRLGLPFQVPAEPTLDWRDGRPLKEM